MAILPIDGGRYGTKEMLAVFHDQKKIDYQLQIEGAAAVSQGEMGLIPRSAAQNIFAAAKSGKITAKRIKQLEAKSDHDTAALVEALSEKCKPDARPWVHYGLTSNDLVDTSTSMQVRDAFAIMQPKTARLAILLAKKAIQYKDVPAVGRTHGQHASIISFGLKFANWAAEMAKHVERIEELKKRVLICKTLGVVGTGSLMGAKAVEVQKRVARDWVCFMPRSQHRSYHEKDTQNTFYSLRYLGAHLKKSQLRLEICSERKSVKWQSTLRRARWEVVPLQ